MGGDSSLMRLAVKDAKMSSQAGLLTAAESNSPDVVKEEMETLTKRVNEIRERLRSGHGISEEEANLIASKYNGENNHATTTKKRTTEFEPEQLRGQVKLPGPGESSTMYSPLAKDSKVYPSGTSKDVAARETNRDVEPMAIKSRFKSTSVEIVNSNPVESTSRALDSIRDEKIDLENQYRSANEKALSASLAADKLETAQRNETMTLERLNVKRQVLQEEFEEKRFEREKAVRNNLKSLDEIEIEVERKGEELEAITLEVEKQQQVVDQVTQNAQNARQEADRLGLVSERLDDALGKATQALEALSDAAEGVTKFASARDVMRRINVF